MRVDNKRDSVSRSTGCKKRDIQRRTPA